jgi:hypothetical protein
MIAKTMMKKKHTNITLARAGSELNRALTTSLRPSFLLITLRGLRALSALSDFRDFNDELVFP